MAGRLVAASLPRHTSSGQMFPTQRTTAELLAQMKAEDETLAFISNVSFGLVVDGLDDYSCARCSRASNTAPGRCSTSGRHRRLPRA